MLLVCWFGLVLSFPLFSLSMDTLRNNKRKERKGNGGTELEMQSSLSSAVWGEGGPTTKGTWGIRDGVASRCVGRCFVVVVVVVFCCDGMEQPKREEKKRETGHTHTHTRRQMKNGRNKKLGR